MKCIVSGGTGFIGRRVVKRLRALGHSVAVWTRKPSGTDQFAWDPLSGEPSAESLNGVEAVVHLAGEPVAQRWNEEVKRRIRDSRVLGTRQLVSAVHRMVDKPTILVSASAIGFYGDRADEVLTEASPAGTGFLADVCLEWEAEADKAADAGLRVAKMRIGIVLGKDGGALAEMIPIFKAFAGGRMGNGRQWMPWIHVDDMADLLVHAVQNPVRGVWNATAPNPVRNAEFTEELAKALHRPAFFPVPAIALKAAFGELGAHMLDSARVMPGAALAANYAFKYPQVAGAVKACLA